MPAPPPNIGQLIGNSNTGYAATVTRADGTVVHSPRTLTNQGGNFTVTTAGAVVEALNIAGLLIINADNVTVRDVRARGARDESSQKLVRKNVSFYYCTIGSTTGPANSESVGCIYMADFLIYRCQVFGWIDLVHVLGGTPEIVETWLHSPYWNPSRGSNHMDPIQPPGESPGSSHNGWTWMLVQGCRFDTFAYTGSQTAGSQIGNYSVTKTTSKAFNIEWGICKEFVFRDNYVRGASAQWAYALNNPTQGGEPGPIIIIDNILEAQPGAAAIYGDKFVNGHNTHITWGRNLDAATGQEIELFYEIVSGSKRFNGIKVNAGPSNLYRSFYTTTNPPPGGGGGGGGGGENPVVSLKVTSPLNGSTHTSGTVNFIGGADGDQNDVDANYNYYNYYIESLTEGVLAKTLDDRDSAANNTGTTYSVAAGGVTFTRYNGAAPETYPPGQYRLTIEGERKDGSIVTGSVVVTFGDVTGPPPPPTSPQITASAEVAVEFRLDVDLSVAGIPEGEIRYLPFPPDRQQPVFRSYWKRTGQRARSLANKWTVEG